MTAPMPRPISWRDWIPVLAVAATIITAIVFIGSVLESVKQNTADIVELRAKADQRDDKLNEKLNTITDRTTRIETKIELLLPQNRAMRADPPQP